MSPTKLCKMLPAVAATAAILLLLGMSVAAETVKIEGLIVGRNGDEITVQPAPDAELTFMLSDKTEVSQIGGLSDPRRLERAMTLLIPGLKVKVEGTYNEARQLIATSIKFKSGDLADAQKMQAGMRHVEVQNEAQQQELERQNAELKAQNEALQQHQEQLTEQQQRIEANKAAIAANTADSVSLMITTFGMKSRCGSVMVKSRLTRNTRPNCWLWQKKPRASMATSLKS